MQVVTEPLFDPVTEHVARAVAKANGNDPERLVQHGVVMVPVWQIFMPHAEVHRAAYEAMRSTEKDRQH